MTYLQHLQRKIFRTVGLFIKDYQDSAFDMEWCEGLDQAVAQISSIVFDFFLRNPQKIKEYLDSIDYDHLSKMEWMVKRCINTTFGTIAMENVTDTWADGLQIGIGILASTSLKYLLENPWAIKDVLGEEFDPGKDYESEELPDYGIISSKYYDVIWGEEENEEEEEENKEINKEWESVYDPLPERSVEPMNTEIF